MGRKSTAAIVASLLAVLSAGAVRGQTPTILQQFFVLKTFAPNVETIGVMVSSERGEDFRKKLAHASAATGMKAVVSVVPGLNQLASRYEELVSKYSVQFIWIPSDDPILAGDLARDFLVRKAVVEGIGILAPREDWVAQGATLFVGSEAGKVKPYYNTRTLQALGLSVPAKYADVATAASE